MVTSRAKTRIRVDLLRAGTGALLRGETAYAELLLQTTMTVVDSQEALCHPDVAECLVHLGNMRMLSDRVAEAEPFYRLAAFIFARALGADHTNVLNTFKKLSQSCWAQGRFAQARQYMEISCRGERRQAVELNRGKFLPVPYAKHEILPFCFRGKQPISASSHRRAG